MKFLLFLLLLPFTIVSKAQVVDLLFSDTAYSFRGLSVVDDQIIWVSGTRGTILKSIDGGNTWQKIVAKGYETIDFRDIEAFDDSTAIIMGVGSPAYILKTTDGGSSWRKVYENSHPDIFLDAMEFSSSQIGYALGDPIDNKFTLIQTMDGGNSWQTMPPPEVADALPGEACFASSGTNIRIWKKGIPVFITGGSSASIVKGKNKSKLPLQQGATSKGANSIALNGNTFIVVGGDFMQAADTTLNCAISNNAGKTWMQPQKSPLGYRSCVEFIRGKQWITCGLNGVDMSNDDGKTWTGISQTGFHVVRKAKKGKAVYFAGGGGRIGKLKP